MADTPPVIFAAPDSPEHDNLMAAVNAAITGKCERVHTFAALRALVSDLGRAIVFSSATLDDATVEEIAGWCCHDEAGCLLVIVADAARDPLPPELAASPAVWDVITPADLCTPAVAQHVLSLICKGFRVEGARVREKQFLGNLLENIPDRIYFKDRQSRFLRISKAMGRAFGAVDAAAFTGKTDFDVFTREHAEEAFQDEQEMMRSEVPLISKVEKETYPDGRSSWVLTTKMPMRDQHGKVIGTFGISRDVTPLKEMEDALEKERNLLRNLLDNIPDQIFVKDPDGRYILDNAAHYSRLGCNSADEVIGKTVHDFFPAELAEKYEADDRAILASGEPLQNTEELIPSGPGGGKRWHLVSKIPVKDVTGKVHYLVGISRDIHDQKTSRQQLAEANQALEQSREQLLRALADLSKSHEDLKAAQLQLIQAEKMESVGRLAAGIAHEVKNPLATIRMGIEYLRHVVPEGSGVPDTLLEMDHAVSRADRVMRELLDFSSAGDLKRVPLSINQVIKKALQLTRAQLERAGIKVSLNLGEDLPQVRLDRIKIEQVIVNLVMNACHAMPGGGDLVIRTSVADAEAAQTRNAGDRSGAATRAGDREVIVEVEDCGTGIPEDKLSVVFDPFFTTKPTGIGTGLGLTVVQKIMELHGGAISLKNKTTGGTGVVARLRFPF